MIWIEGKSSAWTYLSELELSPFIKVAQEKSNRKPASADEIERKAEELRQRVLSSAPKLSFRNQAVEVDSYDSPYKAPEDEIQFIDHRKERKMRTQTVLGEMLLTSLVIGLFMVGIYKGKSFLGVKKAIPNSVATQLNTHDQHTAQKSQVVEAPVIVDTVKQSDSALSVVTSKPKPVVHKRVFVDSIKSTSLTIAPPLTQADNKDGKSNTQTETSAKVPDEIPVQSDVIADTNKNTTAKEEKKGFLRGLFKKKKKDENTSKDE